MILGRGFGGGEIRRLLRPGKVWSFRADELRRRSPFEELRRAEAALSPGETLAGFLSYECAVAAEPQLDLPSAPWPGPAAWFAVFGGFEPIDDLRPPDHVPAPLRILPGQTAGDYANRARNIKERIARGDVFQVNYSHRQSAWFEGGKERLLDRLPWQDAFEARFGALIDLGETALVSASPELFLERRGNLLAAEPIKGTRPRGADSEADRALAEGSVSEPEERGEKIMITDLMRNDLAKVCRDGTIAEPAICTLRTHGAVHHLHSRIEGRLREGVLFADALRAAFPCGSVTGAPKLAAMKVIAELEGEGRGPYCGAVFSVEEGRAAASVGIRTALIDEASGRVDARSGGGVTILSDPYEEFEEAVHKGYLFRHLTGAE